MLLADTVQSLIKSAPDIIRELVKPAERIGEIKVLNVSGGMGGGGGAGGAGAGGNGAGQFPLLGNALGPVAKSILDASAVMPVVREMLRFAEGDGGKGALAGLAGAVEKVLPGLSPAAPPPLPRTGATTRKPSAPTEGA